MLRSAPGGREHLFWAKYATALGVTTLVWLLVFVQEYRTASKMIGETVLRAPCISIDLLKDFPGTVKTFLALLCISKGLSLLIPMQLCVFIGERCGAFEKTLLFSLVTLVIPAAAYRFGIDALGIVTPLSLFADGNILLWDSSGIIMFAVWLVLSFITLFTARQNWCIKK